MWAETASRSRTTTANIGLAIWRLKYFYETFVQGSIAVILLNFCAKKPPHRQAEYRKTTPNRVVFNIFFSFLPNSVQLLQKR